MGKTTPETKVKKSICEFLDELIHLQYPIDWFRRSADGMGYIEGSADIWFVYDGTHVELELKADDGKRSAAQIKWELRCRKSHMKYALVRNKEDLKKFLANEFGLPMED